jgi:hypothetical protein
MMEAARTFETLVNFYQTTRCYNPEDSNLLKDTYSYFYSFFLIEIIIIMRGENFVAHLDDLGGTPVYRVTLRLADNLPVALRLSFRIYRPK